MAKAAVVSAPSGTGASEGLTEFVLGEDDDIGYAGSANVDPGRSTSDRWRRRARRLNCTHRRK